MLCALALSGLAHSGPLVIEHSASISPPDASWRYVGRFGVAIDGDFALVSGERFVGDASQPDGERHEGAALLYQRSGTNWNFVGPLGPVTTLSPSVRPGLAMKDGVAMVILNSAHVFERAGSAWTQSPLHTTLQYGIQGTDIEIDSGRILAARLTCENDAVVIIKEDGIWGSEGALDGHANTCGDSPPLPFLDIQGQLAVVFDAYGPDAQRPAARIFARRYSTWSPYVTFESTVDNYAFGPATALRARFSRSPVRASGAQPSISR